MSAVSPFQQTRALSLSTIAFAVSFAVWTVFSIIGVQIQRDLNLGETGFGLLVGSAAATWLLTLADIYVMFLVAALGMGVAGGTFAVGLAYVSKWYPQGRQGTALGAFGTGNVGSAVTASIAL